MDRYHTAVSIIHDPQWTQKHIKAWGTTLLGDPPPPFYQISTFPPLSPFLSFPPLSLPLLSPSLPSLSFPSFPSLPKYYPTRQLPLH